MIKLLFSYSFRPFFLLAPLYALISVLYWSGAFMGWWPLPTFPLEPSLWHSHEMVFGFAAGGVAGFLFTAIANWTGRPPLAGTPLLILFGLWLLARLGYLFSSLIPLPMTIFADIGFLILLTALAAREVTAVANKRNYVVVGVLALLTLSNAVFYVGREFGSPISRGALVSGLWILLVLINLIGGRIIPAFSRNWLNMQARMKGETLRSAPIEFNKTDQAVILLTVVYGLLFIFPAPEALRLVVALAASLGQFIRLARWKGWLVVQEPLLWILHLAYLWIPIGFLLLACSHMGLLSQSAGLHALGGGAVTTMILAVASRAALGHTNRPLQSGPLLTTSFLLITLAVLCRVVAAAGIHFDVLLPAATLCWVLGLILFLYLYFPILVQPPAKP